MKTIFKAYIVVTLIVAAILIGFYALSGSSVTIGSCGSALLLSAIASVIVMVVWYLVCLWISGPVARFFNKIFEAIGRG